MKKIFVVFATMSLFAAVAVAQEVGGSAGEVKASTYAGSWKLDVEASNMGRRQVKSMTMTVNETETEFSYSRKAEFESNGQRQGRRGFGRRGNRGGGGSQTFKFDASGKETSQEARRGTTKLSMSKSDGKVVLNQVRSFEGPMGEMEIKTVEKWSLSEDGKKLTVVSVTETPRGTREATLVFVKE